MYVHIREPTIPGDQTNPFSRATSSQSAHRHLARDHSLVKRLHVRSRVAISDRCVLLDDFADLGNLVSGEVDVARRKVLDEVLFRLGLRRPMGGKHVVSAQASLQSY